MLSGNLSKEKMMIKKYNKMNEFISYIHLKDIYNKNKDNFYFMHLCIHGFPPLMRFSFKEVILNYCCILRKKIQFF